MDQSLGFLGRTDDQIDAAAAEAHQDDQSQAGLSAETEARIEQRRQSLPELCQSCPARPSAAGGNGLCGKFNVTLEDLVHVKGVFTETDRTGVLGNAATAVAWKLDNKDSLPTEKARANGVPAQIRKAAADAHSSILSMLASGSFISNEFVGHDGQERQLAPAGSGVDICIRPLVDLADLEKVDDVYPLFNVARSILDARQAGAKV